jgi:hypothetical protein
MTETESQVITALIRAFSFLVSLLKKVGNGEKI